MRTVVAAIIPILLGVAFCMASNGLQGTLLGWRAEHEGFPLPLTGVMMTGYYIGFLSGALLAPWIVARVGHVRVYAALASAAAAAAVAHAVFVNWPAWTVFRMVTGFSFAGLYVVIESWLNDRSPNEIRARIFSLYMLVNLTSLAGGPLLLNLADARGFELFTLASVLLSVAVLPVALAPAPAPQFAVRLHLGLRQLYRASPLGIGACFGIGLAISSFHGMGAVFAKQIGLSVAEVSLFMTALVLGAVVLQWPIGHLADRFDRRLVLAATALGAAVVAFLATAAIGASKPALFALVALFGSLSLPIYSLSIAHTNDALKREEMVAGSSGLMLVYGAGAIIGPVSVAATMAVVGPVGFFLYAAAVHAAIGAFAIYRLLRRATVLAQRDSPT